MKQYILFIQGNTKTQPNNDEWENFFASARQSDLFKGGSEIGDRVIVGDTQSAVSSDHIVGYMRFDAEDRQSILNLLEQHPTVLHGGSMELCELPMQ